MNRASSFDTPLYILGGYTMISDPDIGSRYRLSISALSCMVSMMQDLPFPKVRREEFDAFLDILAVIVWVLLLKLIFEHSQERVIAWMHLC
mgnify:FL=1|jgi:hypothetical protein